MKAKKLHSSLQGTNRPTKFDDYVKQIEQDLIQQKKHHKKGVEAIAKKYSIIDRTEIKELTELAIVNVARQIAHLPNKTDYEKFKGMVQLYDNQMSMNHRTSQSILLQQYSTPAPIGYLMGLFCELDKLEKNGGYAFEPSAGNGILTIAGNPSQIYVNEIDTLRNQNLQTQGFKAVWQQDAMDTFMELPHNVLAVLTNPPFGTNPIKIKFDDYEFKTIEHIMALRALQTMANNGKSAIIIGGHTQWDEKGRIQAGKNRIFFNYLYHYYHVLDVLQLDGGKLYSKQGTSFDVRLILIQGRKQEPFGVAPTYNSTHDTPILTFEALYERINIALSIPFQETQKTTTMNTHNIHYSDEELEQLLHDLNSLGEELGMPYNPSSRACVVLQTQVPDSMGFETHSALNEIRQAVGGDMDNFVRHRLGFQSHAELCEALSAEQIDAVAMAIYNIEAKGQGMIIGDQTGIGKGRIASSMIRYAVHQGLKPIFLTEKANLFSDIYRDLVAIGSSHLKPFIVNAKESKTDIKDEEGNVVYQAIPIHEQQAIFQSQHIPANYDFVVATYSQFNSPDKKPEKPNFLRAIAEDTILILDEAHNSSGSSNTGSFLQSVVRHAKGVIFLSATFAKRPDNMPIYAMKTAIADCNLNQEDLIMAITKGGVALQEIISAQLVQEGQMIRRERSFEGVEVNYITLDDREQEHKAIADNVTEILRDIIDFQTNFITPLVDELDTIAVAEGKEVDIRNGTSQAGVDNQPYFSKVFQVINQMLFSIKSEAVADRTIQRLREGKKPIIAFASTMGSFIEQMENTNGMPVSEGDVINADFTEVLKRGLSSIMRYTEKDTNGDAVYKNFEVSELSPEAQFKYHELIKKMQSISTGITISPIDVIIRKIKEAGYSVAEVTGRKYELQMNPKTNQGLLLSRKRINTNDAFRQFNNNEVDVLMINQSGSTGASAHAIVTPKVPKEQVKQRVMIVLQAELDINTEVQKRGRINRTGQILKPIYDYVNSAIPAEKRLMMMLQKKLKSLDANTTSNQKQSTKILDVPDFLNKYGDKIVKEYLMENKEINERLGDPLQLLESGDEADKDNENAAHKVSGRVAVLSTKMQSDFYNEIAERYADYVEYLKQIGEYDLEVETMNLETETLQTKIIKMGKGGDSSFGEDSILETVKANVLRKPFTKIELQNLLKESIGNRDTKEIQEGIKQQYEIYNTEKLQQELNNNQERYKTLIEEARYDKKLLKIKDKQGEVAFQQALKEKIEDLQETQQLSIEQIQKNNANRREYMIRLFNFFFVGKKISYPITTFNNGKEFVLAVFLGFVIDMKKKNPYAPSSLKLRFAISNCSKYFVIPASYSDDIMAIIGGSVEVVQPSMEDLWMEWEQAIKKNITDRNTRYIITGNILQAFTENKGKLVSYTTLQGETKKGILLPEYWELPTEANEDNIVVPIEKTLPIIKSMQQGQALNCTSNISIFKKGYDFQIIVPLSRKEGGEIYLDSELLELIEYKRFEKIGNKMFATFSEKNVEAVCEVLQRRHNISATIPNHLLNTIHKSEAKISNRKPIVPPPNYDDKEEINILELEAEALILELELMD